MILGRTSEHGTFCSLCGGDKLPRVVLTDAEKALPEQQRKWAEEGKQHEQIMDHLRSAHERIMISWGEVGRGKSRWVQYEGPYFNRDFWRGV